MIQLPRGDVTPEGQVAGLRIRLYRIRSKLSAQVIADDLGVSRAALYRYECGAVIKVATLRGIAEILGLSMVAVIAPLSKAERAELRQALLGHVVGDAAAVLLDSEAAA